MPCEDTIPCEGDNKAQNPVPRSPSSWHVPSQGKCSRTHTCTHQHSPKTIRAVRYEGGWGKKERKNNQRCYFLLSVGFPLPEALFILSCSSSFSCTPHSSFGEHNPPGSWRMWRHPDIPAVCVSLSSPSQGVTLPPTPSPILILPAGFGVT